MKNKQVVYRMGSYNLSVEGAYENDEEAIRGLADQYMKISHCSISAPVPSKIVMFSAKIKLFGKLRWIDKCVLTIHPFDPEHIKLAERSFTQPCEFRYEINSDELKSKYKSIK